LRFVPAACTGLCLELLLGLKFAWTALFTSLLPLTGAKAYQKLQLGWSGKAWVLFYFPGVRPTYYIGAPIGIYLFATFYLSAATVLASWRILQNRIGAPPNYEIVLTCALMHVGFLGLFYGFPSSWTYYAAYILVMGVAASDAWSPAAVKFAWGLCILALIGSYRAVKSSIVAWKTMKQSDVTALLFASSTQSAEWNHVISSMNDENQALFTSDGGAELPFSWLQKPICALVSRVATNSEVQLKVQQLRSAKAVIIPTILEFRNPITTWSGPEFQTVLVRTARL
jgi:hypothetical protein